MKQFQTALYKAYFVDSEIGWDVEPHPLFVSGINTNPTIAMQELNFHEPDHSNWFATMRMIEKDEIIEEEWFDSSVIETCY